MNTNVCITVCNQHCSIAMQNHNSCLDQTCVEGTLRLVGGPTIREGRVQMCYNGEWHSVCGDRWSEMGGEADVVCSTLGYSAELGQEAT